MKKRSLFAAVAMLIVSALVLTSATYAWFNVGGGASIKETRGTVMTAGTGIRLKTNKTGVDWNSVLLPQYFDQDGKSSFVQKWRADWDSTLDSGNGGYAYTQTNATDDEAFYRPMSAVPGVNSLSFYAYSIQGDNHFGTAQLGQGKTLANYRDQYEFRVGTLLDADYGSEVTATFKLGGNWDNGSTSALAAARAMVFISYDNGVTYVAYNGTNKYDASGAGKQYYDTSVAPFVYTGDDEAAYNAISSDISTTDLIYDDGGNTTTPSRNFVMNSTDTGFSDNDGCFSEVATTQMKNASGSGQTISLHHVNDINDSKLNGAKMWIKVVVWIEGQDLSCQPALGGSQLTTSWTFEHAGDSTNPNP